MKSDDKQPGRKSPLRAPRWFWIALSTLILLLAVLAGTPVLIERLAEQWLEQHGGDRVEVQDVDFNPFTGILRLTDVSIQVQDRTPLSFDTAELNLAWLPLFSKRIEVQSIELTGFRMVVRNDDVLSIGGIQLPTGQQETATDKPADESTQWAAGIDMLSLHDFTLVYQDRNISSTVYIDKLQLSNLTQWTPEQPARLDYRGRINAAPLTLKATLAPFSATPVYKGSLSLKNLQLSDFESLAQPALEKLAGLVSLGGDFSIEQNDQTLKIRHEGTLSVAAIEVSRPDARVVNQASEWTGTTDLTVVLDGETALKLRSQGKLNIGKLSVELPANKLEVRQDELKLDGKFELSDSASGQTFSLLADIDILQPDLEASEKKMDIISADRFRIKALELDEQPRFKAEEIIADGLNIGRGMTSSRHEDQDTAFFRAGQLLVKNIAYADGSTSIDTIHEEDVHV
ncbi:MAG TPA: DUF748 domain-containing protein, partial [Gammaproteobacteria bacterium]|nr:DUF748 domain-containing protein [Gammaproteobacteria bacterium]